MNKNSTGLFKNSSSISSLNILQDNTSEENISCDSTRVANNNDEFDNKSSKNLIEMQVISHGEDGYKMQEPKAPQKISSVNRNFIKNPFFKDLNLNIKLSRIIFMVFISTLLMLSFFLFIPISQLCINFNYQCPFYSKLVINFVKIENSLATIPTTTIIQTFNESNNFSTSTSKQPTTNLPINQVYYIEVDQSNSKWASMTTCEYSLSVSVLILCYCVITLFFFVMFNMHDIIDNDDCLVIPWFILTLILTLCLFVSNCLITDGFGIFCSNIIQNDYKNSYLGGQCSRAQNFEWKKVANGAYFYTYLLIILICSWFAFLNILIIDFLLLIRIRLNFKLKEHALIVQVAGVFSILHGKRKRKTNENAFKNLAESKL